MLAYQAWNFFAPPPKTDTRVYYVFTPRDGSDKTLNFEILTHLHDRKRRNSPLNTEEQVLDYVLAGAAGGVSDEIRDGLQYLEAVKARIGSHPESLEALKPLERRIDELAEPDKTDSPSVGTLRNYALIVARQNAIDAEKYDGVILITDLTLPKFKDRHKLLDPTHQMEEVVRYQSKKFSLVPGRTANDSTLTASVVSQKGQD